MHRPLIALSTAALLGGCVVAPQRAAVPRPAAAVAIAPVAAPPVAADPWCQQERAEARAAQGMANREAREANYYGGRRQAYDAAAAQGEANRQRRQAQRAC